MVLQIGNAACVLRTVSDRDAFEEILIRYSHFSKPVCPCSFFETCFYRSTGIVVGMSCWLVVFCCYWESSWCRIY